MKLLCLIDGVCQHWGKADPPQSVCDRCQHKVIEQPKKGVDKCARYRYDEVWCYAYDTWRKDCERCDWE